MQSPDLDQAETFLTEFGMVRAARTSTALYMRGTDPAHHIHITELGEPRFLGLGFAVSDPDDLKRLAQLQVPQGSSPSTSPVAASGCGSPTRMGMASRLSMA